MTADPGAAGERIEQLLDSFPTVSRDRAEELVRVVVDLYGAGLERLLEIAHDAGKLDEGLLDQLAADPLVASLLLVHDLHPQSFEERVARAVAGSGARLVDVSEGVVTLQGSGCSTAAVAEAIRVAAPEVVAIEVQEADAGLIPVSALTSRLARA